MKKYFLILAALAFFFLSCEKNDSSLDQSGLDSGETALLTLSDTEFPPLGDSRQVGFYADESWEVSQVPSWVTVSPDHGRAGNTLLTIKTDVGEFSEYKDNVREGVISFVSKSTGDQIQSFKLSQQRPYIHVSIDGGNAIQLDDFDKVFEWNEYGTNVNPLELVVESNIDWNFISDNEKYGVEKGELHKSEDDRFFRKHVVTVLPKDFNASLEKSNCKVTFQPAQETEIELSKVDCPKPEWKFSHKNLVFLVNGLADFAEPVDMGELTAKYADHDLDADNHQRPVREFQITTLKEQGIDLSKIQIAVPSWMSESKVGSDGKFTLKVSAVFFDEQVVTSREDFVVLHSSAKNAEGKDVKIERKIPVKQYPFRFVVQENGTPSTNKISFKNDNVYNVPNKLTVQTLGPWELESVTADKWIAGSILKEYDFDEEAVVFPKGQNMNISENNSSIITVRSKVDSSISKDIEVTQDKFIFNLEEPEADVTKRIGNMYSGDIADHELNLRMSGEWEAKVINEKDDTECNWIKLSKTSGNGDDISGEQLTFTPQSMNVSEDTDRKARLVITSVRHQKMGLKDTLQRMALQKHFYIDVILVDNFNGKEYRQEDGKTLIIPAYKNVPNKYTVKVDCSPEAIKGVKYDYPDDILTDIQPTTHYSLKSVASAIESKSKDFWMLNRRQKTDSAEKDFSIVLEYSKDIKGDIERKTKTFKIKQEAYVNSMENASFEAIHSYNVPAGGEKYSFKMTDESPWTATFDGDSGKWIKLDKIKGTGSADLTITIERNPTSESRTGTIIMRDEFTGDEKGITIQQDAYVFETKLYDSKGKEVSKETGMKFKELGSEYNKDEVYSIGIKSSGPVEIQNVSGSNWIVADKTSLSGDGEVKLTATLNKDRSTRSTNGVTVFPKILSDNIRNLAQLESVIIPSKYSAFQDAYKWEFGVYKYDGKTKVSNADFSAVDSESYILKVKSSGPWEANKPDWLVGDELKGEGSQDNDNPEEFTFKAENNRGDKIKNGTLSIKEKLAKYSGEVKLSQAAFSLNLSKDSEKRSEALDQGISTFSIISTTSRLKINNDNEDCVEAKLNGNIVTLTPKRNVTKSLRTAKIKVLNEDCDFSKSFTFEQEAYKFDVDASKLSVFNAMSPATQTVAVTTSKDAKWQWKVMEGAAIQPQINLIANGISISLNDNTEIKDKAAEVKLYSTDNEDIFETFIIRQEGYRLNVEKGTLSFDAVPAQGQQQKIVCSGSWKIESAEDWISFSPQSGKLDSDVTVSVEDNPTEKERSAVVSVVSTDNEDIRRGFKVVQNPYVLSVSPEMLSFDAKPKTLQSLAIACSGKWNVSCESDWVKIQKGGDSNLNVSVNENTAKDARTAEIVISGENTAVTRVVTVTQMAASKK